MKFLGYQVRAFWFRSPRDVISARLDGALCLRELLPKYSAALGLVDTCRVLYVTST